jgi:hypothetical protein
MRILFNGVYIKLNKNFTRYGVSLLSLAVNGSQNIDTVHIFGQYSHHFISCEIIEGAQ